jgi:hypothetical protein
MAALFDTLKYTKSAEAVGIPRKHAEFQAEEMAKLIDNTLATKNDLKDLELRLLIKMGTMMVVCSGLIMSVLGFIMKH